MGEDGGASMSLSLMTNLFCFFKPFLFYTGYISSNSSFPEPLSKEEEEKYLQLYAKGDEEARNVLIERNLRLVAHMVKKYNNTGKDTDDLISIGTIGLIKAIKTYDPTKGTRLATYAARCIDNAMLSKCYIIIYQKHQYVGRFHPNGFGLQFLVLSFFFVHKELHLQFYKIL